MSRFTKIDADHPLVSDTTTGLTWTAADVTGKGVPHAKGIAAIEKLIKARFGGFDDWRLPSVEELFFLADRTKFAPAIDTDFFPTCANDWYWTSTDFAASPRDSAWVVLFSYGSAYAARHASHARVRAVRGPSRQ